MFDIVADPIGMGLFFGNPISVYAPLYMFDCVLF